MRGKPFSKGYDPRRKVLSTEECRKGYRNAPSKIRSRIRSMYRGKKIVKRGPGAFLPTEGEVS